MKKGIKSRGHGTGSALHVSTNNWKAIAVIGYNAEGNPIRRTKSGFKTRTEALAYIPTLKRVKQEKKPVRLYEAFTEWEKTADCSQSTLWCYKAGFKLFEELYYLPLADLDIDDLQECLDSCDKGKRTRQNAKVALGLVYKWAIPRGYTDLNLAQYLKVGGADESQRKEGFSPAQLEQIKKAIGSIPVARIIYCHCYLGFRPSALLALKKCDYHPEGHYFVGGIKTEAGKNRIVTISPKIQPYVDSLLSSAQGNYIFSLTNDKMSMRKYRSAFYDCLEILGIQAEGEHTYTPHSCRHTFATLMKRVPGADKDKLELIGHTSTAMLSYYQDVSLDDLRAITDAL